ncbi:MAG: NAD(+) synthase [Clostridiales bacterium]|nr:NAD(+) synthase [Clostridiales bacterium]
MRNYEQETENRVEWIRSRLESAGTTGIVFGNSGGKDSALVGILCKKACDDTLGVIMPVSKRNFDEDTRDGFELAEKFGIETRSVALDGVRDAFLSVLSPAADITDMARANMSPRLRMTALYAIAASENRLVAGTGNRSETHVGYFTKWGDGAYDFNPIADLTVTEVYEFLHHLEATDAILTKVPSGALFDGQTDEDELGITYAALDRYLLTGEAEDRDRKMIDGYFSRSEHKRGMPSKYGDA